MLQVIFMQLVKKLCLCHYFP